MAQILIIEDEDNVRSLLVTMLEEAGYQVVNKANGNEGVEAFKAQKFDLVVTDIMMPEKDGIETIRELRKEDPHAKIIAITGYRGRFNRLPAAEFLGAQRTLVKPFKQSELVQAIKDIIG